MSKAREMLFYPQQGRAMETFVFTLTKPETRNVTKATKFLVSSSLSKFVLYMKRNLFHSDKQCKTTIDLKFQ